MTARNYAPIQGEVMRLTEVDSCGDQVSGPCAVAISGGFVQVVLADVQQAGTEYQQKTANGRFVVDKLGKPRLRWYTVTIDFCLVAHAVWHVLSGVDIVRDYSGVHEVGFQSTDDTNNRSFMLEVWQNIPDSCVPVTCGPLDTELWAYWLFPVTNGIKKGQTIADATTTFQFEGITFRNGSWGVGPYDVVAADAIDTPGPLISPGLLPTAHEYNTLTSIAPPDPEENCGCIAVA